MKFPLISGIVFLAASAAWLWMPIWPFAWLFEHIRLRYFEAAICFGGAIWGFLVAWAHRDRKAPARGEAEG